MPDFDLIAVAWYRPEVYERFLALAPDGGGMEKTFDEWKKFADQAMVEVLRHGKRVVRIDMDPDEFTAWLARKHLKSTPENRAAFVSEIANKKHGTN